MLFNAKYLDFSRHWGFEISPCNVRAGNEKGRVENGVGFVKKNFLAGLELADFSTMQSAAQLWVDTVADVRMHESTHQRPTDRFEDERTKLTSLNPAGFDLARLTTVRATKQFRVSLDSNHYSVPARYAGQRLTLKSYADRLCIYAGDQLVARHRRSMDRHQDIEDQEHAEVLVAQRKSAREQRLLVQFLALSPRAQAYFEGLELKRINARAHMRKIVALAEIHCKEAVCRALDDGLQLQAFSSEYIANIQAARRRLVGEPAALRMTPTSQKIHLQFPTGQIHACWLQRPHAVCPHYGKVRKAGPVPRISQRPVGVSQTEMADLGSCIGCWQFSRLRSGPYQAAGGPPRGTLVNTPLLKFHDVGKESLDHIEPRCALERKDRVKAVMQGTPCLDLGVLVRSVVVHHRVELFAIRSSAINQLEKAQPLSTEMQVIGDR